MAGIWAHPLLKKYEVYHQSLVTEGELVGPPPPLSAEDCGHRIGKRADIDAELLRNLQTLWHGEKQETLIEKLLNEEYVSISLAISFAAIGVRF
jgi:serine/threonine-protein kinase HSL1, negative regulator of Swe1 kinase